jgi:uncharacterized protein YdhG (YjbR/CyaY superfamily)
MAIADIDNYIAALPEPKRSTLEEMRRRILAVVPNAEQQISYNTPTFALGGKAVAGFAAFSKHLSYLPHSGRVFDRLPAEVAGFVRTSGALHFAVDEPLSLDLIAKLIEAKMQVLEEDGQWQRPIE